MKINGISYNVEYAKATDIKTWVARHIGLFPDVSEENACKKLTAVYNELTGSKKQQPEKKSE